MTTRVHTVKLSVSHMRKPSDRMPVCCVNRSKGPQNALGRYSACYMGVIGNIGIIVESQELVISDL
jgi:hypothetical protein